MADDLGIEVSEPHSRKVSRCLDENRENQHVMVSNEEMFRVTFFYEVLDVMISERGDLIKSQGSFRHSWETFRSGKWQRILYFLL